MGHLSIYAKGTEPEKQRPRRDAGKGIYAKGAELEERKAGLE